MSEQANEAPRTLQAASNVLPMTPMTTSQQSLSAPVADVDVAREAEEHISQQLSSAEIAESVGASSGEESGDDDSFMDWETRNESIPMGKHIIAGKFEEARAS